jgi:hypothetical protein
MSMQVDAYGCGLLWQWQSFWAGGGRSAALLAVGRRPELISASTCITS